MLRYDKNFYIHAYQPNPIYINLEKANIKMRSTRQTPLPKLPYFDDDNGSPEREAMEE